MGRKNGRPAQHIQSTYDGFLMIHRYEDQAHIQDIIRWHKPDRAVELGTAQGGLAAMFAATLGAWGGTVTSFDRQQDPGIEKELVGLYPNLALIELDILDGPGVEFIRGILNQPNSFLYTDNGNKHRELQLYAPHLGPHALVGTHDYDTEVDPAWAEPFMAGLGYEPYFHEKFEALTTEYYWDSLTRFWRRP
jgi:cephalosporin hydroxylase